MDMFANEPPGSQDRRDRGWRSLEAPSWSWLSTNIGVRVGADHFPKRYLATLESREVPEATSTRTGKVPAPPAHFGMVRLVGQPIPFLDLPITGDAINSRNHYIQFCFEFFEEEATIPYQTVALPILEDDSAIVGILLLPDFYFNSDSDIDSELGDRIRGKSNGPENKSNESKCNGTGTTTLPTAGAHQACWIRTGYFRVEYDTDQVPEEFHIVLERTERKTITLI